MNCTDADRAGDLQGLQGLQAIFWRSILTRLIGAKTHVLSCSLAMNWVCPLRWKFLGLVMARTRGCSSPTASLPAMPGAWGQRSSAMGYLWLILSEHAELCWILQRRWTAVA
jgi:hypothetical protein